jgi:hypothetical protein
VRKTKVSVWHWWAAPTRSAPRRLPLAIMTLAVSVPLASRMPKKNCSSNVALRANPQRHNGHHGG